MQLAQRKQFAWYSCWCLFARGIQFACSQLTNNPHSFVALTLPSKPGQRPDSGFLHSAQLGRGILRSCALCECVNAVAHKNERCAPLRFAAPIVENNTDNDARLLLGILIVVHSKSRIDSVELDCPRVGSRVGQRYASQLRSCSCSLYRAVSRAPRMTGLIVTVFGATGFLGRYVVNKFGVCGAGVFLFFFFPLFSTLHTRQAALVRESSFRIAARKKTFST